MTSYFFFFLAQALSAARSICTYIHMYVYTKYTIYRNHARDLLVDFINDLNQIAWYRSNVADDARHAATCQYSQKMHTLRFQTKKC